MSTNQMKPATLLSGFCMVYAHMSNKPVDEGQDNSPFANALLSVLRNPLAPAFTMQQVFPELQKRVSNSTNQTPEFPRLRGDAGAAGDGGAMVGVVD